MQQGPKRIRTPGVILVTKPNKKKRRRGTAMSNAYKHCAKYNIGRMLPVPGCTGDALCVDSVSRTTVHTQADWDTFLVFQWTDSCVRGVALKSNRHADLVTLTATQLISGVPVTVRPLRMSVCIRNTTVLTDQQGFVRVLNSPSPLEWEWDPVYDGVTAGGINVVTHNMMNELQDVMNSHPKVHTFAAVDLTHGRRWVMPPAQMGQFKTWHPYDPDVTALHAKATLAGNTAQNPLNTLIMFFPKGPKSQTYDVSMYDQTATRHSIHTLYGHLQKPVPPGPNDAAFLAGMRAEHARAGAGAHDNPPPPVR
jgi:hypothetical protein